MPLIGTPNKPFTLKPRSQQNGKSRRVDKEKFDAGWDKIFGEKKNEVRNEKRAD